jgi:antitoxin component of RelBE/YafQ-DinJ toxin-antitoxin module
MAKDQTTLSIDKTTKQKAEEMAKKMHLSLSGVARILLNDFADGKIRIATVMVVRDENNFTSKETNELDTALSDIAQNKNLEGPFNSAEDFIGSLKK